MRVGLGFDVHHLEIGRRLVLGGVEIPSDLGLRGHSDADVICHALIDALLGAAGLGDIGTLFPDTDAAFKDARSLDLLVETVRRCRDAGWRVENVDVTLLAQAPRLAPYRDRIRASLAGALGVEEVAVSVKGKTPDHLGALGRGEGMAAQAVVLIEQAA